MGTNASIQIVDLGSRDRTVKICHKYGANVSWEPSITNRSLIRNRIIEKSNSPWHMYIEPWEVLSKGGLTNLDSGVYHVSVLNNNLLTKEIRLWSTNHSVKFVNPVFEKIDVSSEKECPVILCSNHTPDYKLLLENLELWKSNEPTNPTPYYYQSCVLLGQGKFKEFMKISSHYMFLEKQESMSKVMNQYYYAMVSLFEDRKVKPTLQNLTLCLSQKPLMAEFWCLTGDVYYHLLNDFSKAKTFYQNAIILGKHRRKDDKWPMDITKYNQYPSKMIKSCDDILENTVAYKQS